MASKSFKVGFSMNIKMMLFPQFVSCILNFLFCQPIVCPFISSPMSNTACYCKIVKSNTAAQFLPFPPSCLFHRKVFSGKLNQTLFRSSQKIKKRSGRKSLLDASDEMANFQLNNKTSKSLQVSISFNAIALLGKGQP